MKQVVGYEHEATRTLEWWEFSLAYIEAADLLLQKREEMQELSENPMPNLAVPALYSLRHAIELLLKFLSLAFGTSFSYTHHLHRLFASIERQLLSIDMNQIEAAAASLGIESDELIKFMQGSTADLERIVTKYYCVTGVGDDVEDKGNEAFRYPSTLNDGAALKVTMGIEDLSIGTVRDDIGKLRMYLFCVLMTFGKRTDGRHFFDEFNNAG